METWQTENKFMSRLFLLTLLDQLGNTAHDVALNLEKAAIRGQRLAPRCLNPLVQYVCRKVASCWAAEVTDGQIQLYFIDREAETAPLPVALKEFLSEFDHGRFPFLELEQALEPAIVS